LINEFPGKTINGQGKQELKLSGFICVYPWFLRICGSMH